MSGANLLQAVVLREMKTEDIEKIAALHCRVFPGYFLTQMGGKFLTYYYAAYVDNPGNYAYVAEYKGQIIGLVAGTEDSASLYRKFYQENFTKLAAIVLARTILNRSVRSKVLERRAHINRAFASLLKPKDKRSIPEKQPFKQCRLLSIGIEEEFRGSGVGSLLLNHFCKEIRAKGAQGVGLSVLPENQRAIAFYHKMGLELEHQRENSLGFMRVF